MLNLVYAVAATSWLLYWFFFAGCYQALLISSIFQYDAAANLMRKALRKGLGSLDYISDKVAFFNLPALEIDTEVDGLMVIRGLTISLSSLTIIAHGIEVGIKLSDDMELALLTEKVTVSLFRKIEVADVYGNLKGGEYEMTFRSLASDTHDENGKSFMISDSPLLRRATATGLSPPPNKVQMTSVMTDGAPPEDTDPSQGLKSARKLNLDDSKAADKYNETLAYIADTSLIGQGRDIIAQVINSRPTGDENTFDPRNERDMRAAVCSFLHDRPSIPHPPSRSVRVTTLQYLSPPFVREFLHRLPMLLRLLLNILSYFHPVHIASISVGASGQWITSMLKQHVFQQYGSSDSEVKRLEQKVLAWLADADFVVELGKFLGLAQVPFLSNYDIECKVGLEDVMVYRALPNNVYLKQVIRFSGADASVTVPMFLLPHHEHLFPPAPTKQDVRKHEEKMRRSDSRLDVLNAQFDLEQTKNDEANVLISAHARLPATLDQELLDFVAALVKATKIIEMEKDPGPMEHEVRGVKEFTKAMKTGFKESVKRVAVDAVANDKWIAKMVGKVSKNLETLRGEVGYSGEIPVALGPYREHAEKLAKLLA